jgi:hypothetical protein
MSKPNEALHGVVVSSVTARTRAYSACGVPLIHGSVSGGAATGEVRLVSE